MRRMKLIKKEIGRKDFQGSVDITDPCYNRNVWCRMNAVQIHEGEYDCCVWYETRSNTYGGKVCTSKIVKIIGIYFHGIVPLQDSMEEIGEIGVDAGIAGFFHQKPDYDVDGWSNFCSTLRNGDAWLTDAGFFSYSGDGDGAYPVYAYRLPDNGTICALEIRF